MSTSFNGLQKSVEVTRMKDTKVENEAEYYTKAYAKAYSQAIAQYKSEDYAKLFAHAYAEAFVEGIKIGKREIAIKVASELLKRGDSVDFVYEITGLNHEEIVELKNKINL